MNEFTKNEPHWTSCSVRDWTVVLWFFFCGKVLRRKNYHPKDAGNNMSAFQGLPRMTIRRILLLIKLWGCRPLTMDKFDRLKEATQPLNTEWLQRDDSWGNQNRCFRVRL